jgi:hypothetical protein
MVTTRGALQLPVHIKAISPDSSDQRLEHFSRGRVCESPGCTTVLSTYNADPTCWQHAPRRPYAQISPRKPPPHVDDDQVLATFASVLARMPGPDPEPNGPPSPPPMPNPEPGPPPAE